MSGNCLGVIISGQLFYGAIASCQGLISGEAIFWGAIILGGGGGNCPGINCPWGNYPGNNCPGAIILFPPL